MKSVYSLFAVLAIMMAGCNNSGSTTQGQEITDEMSRAVADSQIYTIRQFQDDNTFIDFDFNIDSVNNQYSVYYDNNFEGVPADFRYKFTSIKAAEYRLFTTGKFDGTYFSTDLKSGDEINVSPRVFAYLTDLVSRANAETKKMVESGLDMSLTPERFKKQFEAELDRDWFNMESLTAVPEYLRQEINEKLKDAQSKES